MKKENLLVGFTAFALASMAALFLISSLRATELAARTEDTGLETCLECHEAQHKNYLRSVHYQTEKKRMKIRGCEACHGPAETHLEEGGGAGTIFAFKASDLATEKSEKCITCHTRSSSRYLASPHGKASLDCTTCHIIHSESPKPSMLRTGSTESCYSCHEDVFSEFQLNERHRLQEGIMGCTTCHNPHQPATRERLGGFKDQACLRCHADKGGPFLYEHGASRIEGCTACHEVHGSPNRHLLAQQSIADLCFSCHTLAPDWHSRFGSYTTNCTTCHSTIHGSNTSKIFLK